MESSEERERSTRLESTEPGFTASTRSMMGMDVPSLLSCDLFLACGRFTNYT